MSSATSIESAAAPAPGSARPRDVFKPWHFFVLAALVTATAAVVMTRQARPEHLVLISLTIGAAAFAGAAFYRTLLPLVSAEAAMPVAPLTEGTRAALEREKQLALRAIKELEFDRAMGKVSARDFDDMAARLRGRALSLMKQLDAEGGYRELIERELAARLKRMPAGADPPPAAGGDRAPRTAGTCACGTANDADASFCKRCGARLAGAAS